MRRNLYALTSLMLLTASAGLAVQPLTHNDARPSVPGAQPRDAREGEAPLRGPAVRLTEAPGVYMSFGGESGGRMFRANLRLYSIILRQMDLTDEQRAQAEAIGAEYAAAMRAHQEQFGGEQRRLQQRLERIRGADGQRREDAQAMDRPARRAAPQQADQPGDRPPADRRGDAPQRRPDARPDAPPDSPPRDADAPPRRPLAGNRPGAESPEGQSPPPPERMDAATETAERLAAIRRAIPPQEPYMMRLFDLLTDGQKQEFERRLLEQVRAQAQEQMQRRLAAAGREAPAMDDGAGMMMEGMVRTGDGGFTIDESQLTPQMRERLRRLRQERQRMLENRGRDNPVPPPADDIEFEDDPARPRRPDRARGRSDG